jgi:hypothetical protein
MLMQQGFVKMWREIPPCLDSRPTHFVALLVLCSLFVELVEWVLIDLPIDIYMYEGGLVWKIH